MIVSIIAAYTFMVRGGMHKDMPLIAALVLVVGFPILGWLVVWAWPKNERITTLMTLLILISIVTGDRETVWEFVSGR